MFLVKNKILYRRAALITIQKTVRGYFARKRHGPRIKGIQKIRGLDGKLKQLESIAGQLKKERDSSIKEINSLRSEINAAVTNIKVNRW